ncbi:hypothetical protein P3T76_015252 [Phytophthora citrophthora]|uniref:Uncharacterized protein n=1 Tax=Phytophthora citrophthora TaxID=4793 RepID=A0AAD9LAG7_9STRA|nr:hypothetical protein P3T76_015252 [Phytophthora citrophthora]
MPLATTPQRHPWQLFASAMPLTEAQTLLTQLKKYRVDKSNLAPCNVCMLPTPHSMRVQRLRCSCTACTDVTTLEKCPWRARVLRCQLQSFVTV